MPAFNPNIETIAKEFWEKAGGPTRYPCDIQRAVSLAKNVYVVSIPLLHMDLIYQWLNERSFHFQLPRFEKSLHGFLLTNKGEGFVFLNGTDSEEERRFTLAHEISHFILDYEQPRQQAVKKFGASILEVLDGVRPLTVEERIQGLISIQGLTLFTHLLDDEAMSGIGRLQVWEAESRADQLALELLAPERQVRRQINRLKEQSRLKDYKGAISGILSDYYGLPITVSESYATYLSKKFTGGATFAERWGFR